MKKIILLFTGLVIYCEIFSQSQYLISKENADCDNPIILDDTIYVTANAPYGYGKVMEITAEKNNIYYFEKEHNTVWYRFAVPHNCMLTFEIIPEDTKNDYDFILFKYTDINFCKDLKNRKIRPVRSNISRNDPEINSITGLSMDSKVDYVHAGPGQQFSKALEVKKDEIYYLAVDNVYDNGKGHTLKLHYSGCSESDGQYISQLNLNIFDKATQKPIKASIDIYLSNSREDKKPDYHFDDTTGCTVKLDNRQTYFVQLATKGYLNYTQEITFQKGQTIFNLKAEMGRIEIGGNFNIENIYFVGNLAKIISTSTPALLHLLKFMRENPSVNIEIQGHVNWPSKYDEPTQEENAFNMNLSNERAKAIFDYLARNKIDPSRMTYKGYGSSQMIFPNAKSPREEQLNRRVEIEITSY
jgi:outer membrane protein OmpA-like peptidoglycan-associated protein